MRFALLHKIASYLLAASGFAALAFSGELPPLAMLLTVLGGFASFFLEPARQPVLRGNAWTVGWNVVSLLVFGASALAVVRGEPFLLVGAQALCFLLVNKLCNRRASRDYLQVYVLSFLMLVAGTTLNTDLAFAPCFFAYVICATWAFTLLHLRREMEDNLLLKHTDSSSERVEVDRVLGSRRVVGGAFLGVTSVMSAAIFAVSGTFFFAFPRIGWNAFFRSARHGLTMGFNDKGVNLGENGLLKDNDQVVMRIEFPGGRPLRPLHFRGISFERYRDGRWTPDPDLVRHPLRRYAGMALAGVPQTRRGNAGGEAREKLKRAIKQEIYLEPMESSVLFAASTPVAVAIAMRDTGMGAPDVAVEGAWSEYDLDDDDEVDTVEPTGDIYAWRPPGGVRYKAFSIIDSPDEKLLARSAPPSAEKAAGLAEYLDVAGVSPRVVALGRSLTDKAKSPAAKVEALMRHLRGDFRYTVQLVHDPRKEPVEEFLFDRKEGHCEYFASSLALLLRAAGVPSRHVAGFYGGEWNEVGKYLRVRQRDAHAWVEAWLGDEVGWVTFDPTPASAGFEQPGGLATRLRQMLDVVELAWFKYVIEYDLTTQLDLLARLRRWLSSDGDRKHGGKASGPATSILTHRRELVIAGAVLALAIGAWVAWRRRGRRDGRGPRRAVAATRAIERAMRALERRGCERGPGDTPRDLLGRARRLDDPGAEPFADLVSLYYAARFGGQAVDPLELSRLAAQVVRPPALPPTDDSARSGRSAI